MPDPIKMIIDTDPGVDDAMAIFYAARDPRIRLLGLTSVFGNVTVEIATRNALRLCDMAGLDIPVAEGAAKPIVLPPFPPSSAIHGEEGFGSIGPELATREKTNEDAADFMARTAREDPGQVTICAIGPITNLAEALRRHSDFAANVARIVLMGGAVHVPGNITPYAEANTYHDPHALAEVIGSGADVVLVGLDVTMQILCNSADFAALAEADPHLGVFLVAATKNYIRYYQDNGHAGCGLHDPAAVIACLDPDLFEIVETPVSVVLDGEKIGQTRPDGDRSIQVCVDVDAKAVKNRFFAAFGARPDG